MRGTIPCPQCDASAQISERFWLDSTAGPVEHVKTGCERGHWFTPTVESLHLQPATTTASPALVPVP
jgi:hypothetical protein